MERKVMIVCCVVGFLGLLSAATSFAAEATRVKVSVFFPFFFVFFFLTLVSSKTHQVKFQSFAMFLWFIYH